MYDRSLMNDENIPTVGAKKEFRYAKAHDEHNREYYMPITTTGNFSDHAVGVLIKVFRYELQQIVGEEVAKALEARFGPKDAPADPTDG